MHNYNKIVPHIFAAETVTSIIVTQRSTNIIVTEIINCITAMEIQD